ALSTLSLHDALPIFLGALFASYIPFIPRVARDGAIIETIEWIPGLNLAFDLHVDALSLSMAMLVTGAGALILLYCRWYFHAGDGAIARFSAIFLGFSASMLGLVLADNVYLLFVFWELTSVFSFLLVGH